MESRTLHLQGSLWMMAGEENFGGMGRITLLERIAEYGSITHAARSMKMSYKAAWDAVDMMNNLATEPVVLRQTGGKGGGRTHLTEHGKLLISQFTALKNEHQRFIDTLNKQLNGCAEDAPLITRVAVKTSARNQFIGRVTHIKREDLNAEVFIDIGGDMIVAAQVTEESVADLHLRRGDEVFALIKSPSVWIEAPNEANADDNEGVNPTLKRNRLKGVVADIKKGKHHHEIIVTLSHQQTACAVVSHEDFATLSLSQGDAVYAVFKPTAVIVGKAM